MVLEQQTGLKKSSWFTKWHKIPWSQYRDMTSFSGCKVSCNSRKDQFFLIEKPKSLFILCQMSMRRQHLTSLHYPRYFTVWSCTNHITTLSPHLLICTYWKMDERNSKGLSSPCILWLDSVLQNVYSFLLHAFATYVTFLLEFISLL